MSHRTILIFLSFVAFFPTLVGAQTSLSLELLEKYCTQYTSTDFFALPETKSEIDLEQPDLTLATAALFHAANEQRAKKRLALFGFSAELSLASASQLADMRKHDYFGHRNPKDPKAPKIGDRLRRFLPGLNYAAENLADITAWRMRRGESYFIEQYQAGRYVFLGEDDKPLPTETYAGFARKATGEWMASPPHRANLVDPDFTLIGVAVKFPGNPFGSEEMPLTLVGQCFGRL